MAIIDIIVVVHQKFMKPYFLPEQKQNVISNENAHPTIALLPNSYCVQFNSN